MPPLPGLRQHHRLRHGPRHSRSTRGLSPHRRRAALVRPGGPSPKYKSNGWVATFQATAKGKVRLNVPFCDLNEAEQDKVFAAFIHEFFEYLETKKYKVHVRVLLSRYRGYARCPDCHGSRLRKDALWVRVGEKNIGDAVRMNIAEAGQFFDTLTLTPEESAIAEKILIEIRQRLKFLYDVGLEYLTLDRLASTLSGGEAQRIQLATCLGSRLVGACYVLDEPSIGLHSRDTARLVHILHELRELGNTILVVEHDPDVMRAADHIVDLGPGAGEHGGSIVFEGSYPEIVADRNGSLTGYYLRGEKRVSAPRGRAARSRADHALLRGARTQSQECGCGDPAECDGRGHGRLRLRQIDARARRDLPLARGPAQGPRRGSKGRGRKNGPLRTTRRRFEADLPARGRCGTAAADRHDRPVAHRPDAALESRHLHQGFRYHPEPFRFHARSREARLHGRSFFLQRARRTLRDLPGRRHGHRGDAVPRRRGTGLRGVQRHALQERDPRYPI